MLLHIEEFDDVVENHLIEIVKQNQRNNEQHDGHADECALVRTDRGRRIIASTEKS